jgi:hypothetical protein
VGAGERHHIRAPAGILDEAGCEFGRDLLIRNGAAGQLRFREAGEAP